MGFEKLGLEKLVLEKPGSFWVVITVVGDGRTPRRRGSPLLVVVRWPWRWWVVACRIHSMTVESFRVLEGKQRFSSKLRIKKSSDRGFVYIRIRINDGYEIAVCVCVFLVTIILFYTTSFWILL